MWNSSKINLDHDYPPEIMAMRREYAEARKILKEKNLRFRTRYPVRLKVFFEEGAKTYNTVEESTADLVRWGMLVKVIKPPATPREKLQRCPLWRGVGGRPATESRSCRIQREAASIQARRGLI